MEIHIALIHWETDNGQRKGTENIEKLKAFVRQYKYIDVMEQRKICASFGLPYMVSIFRKEYTGRFLNYLKEHTTTCAAVYKATNIDHKYLCQVKARLLEEKGLLKVVGLGRCPATFSPNVQFLSTNPENWDDASQIPDDQYKLKFL